MNWPSGGSHMGTRQHVKAMTRPPAAGGSSMTCTRNSRKGKVALSCAVMSSTEGITDTRYARSGYLTFTKTMDSAAIFLRVIKTGVFSSGIPSNNSAVLP